MGRVVYSTKTCFYKNLIVTVRTNVLVLDIILISNVFYTTDMAQLQSDEDYVIEFSLYLMI